MIQVTNNHLDDLLLHMLGRTKGCAYCNMPSRSTKTFLPCIVMRFTGKFSKQSMQSFYSLEVPNGTYDNAMQISGRSEDLKRDFLPVEHFPGFNTMCHFGQAGKLLVSKRAKYVCLLEHKKTASSASRMLTIPFPMIFN